MNVLEASVEILKIVTSGQSIDGGDIDSKTDKILESFHKIYKEIDLTVNPNKRYDFSSDTLETIDPTLKGSIKIIDPTFEGNIKIMDPTFEGSIQIMDPTFEGSIQIIDPTLGGSIQIIDPTLGGSRDVEILDETVQGR